MLSGLVTAMRTLTVLSVPGRDTEMFSRSLYWFPVVGLLLGLLQSLLAYIGHVAGWNELAAALTLIGGVVLTRGMHADGLADVADGFWGGRTREAALRIMKDSSIGTFGALALIGSMLLKWLAILKLIEFGAFHLIVAGVLLARLVQVLLASSLPYARSEGGTAQSFVQGAGIWHCIVSIILTLSFLIPLCYPLYRPLFFVIGAALAAAVLIGLLSYRKIGGVTGDVLGAGSEVTEVFAWIAAALFYTFQPL